MTFPPFPRRAAVLATAAACLGAAICGSNPALATEREDIEQLRSTALGLIQALVEQGLISREKAKSNGGSIRVKSKAMRERVIRAIRTAAAMPA